MSEVNVPPTSVQLRLLQAHDANQQIKAMLSCSTI